MKVGILTDSHLGIDRINPNIILETLNSIADYFETQDVDAVIHLGDIIQETPEQTDSFARQATNIFSRFDQRYLLPGNHDLIDLPLEFYKDQGWEIPPCTIETETNNTIIFADTIAESPTENLGYISEESIDLICSDYSHPITILSHYPIDTVGKESYSNVFTYLPELAYPINKSDVQMSLASGDVSVDRLICGHLHPTSTVNTTGLVTGYDMTVVEPIVNFHMNDAGTYVNASVNSDISYDNLIYTF